MFLIDKVLHRFEEVSHWPVISRGQRKDPVCVDTFPVEFYVILETIRSLDEPAFNVDGIDSVFLSQERHLL